jgi:hypothetical protein
MFIRWSAGADAGVGVETTVDDMRVKESSVSVE